MSNYFDSTRDWIQKFRVDQVTLHLHEIDSISKIRSIYCIAKALLVIYYITSNKYSANDVIFKYFQFKINC